MKDLRYLYDQKLSITKECINCQTRFETYNINQQLCSRSCSGKHRRKTNLNAGKSGWFKNGECSFY